MITETHWSGWITGADGPIPTCCCYKHAGANVCPDCPRHRGERELSGEEMDEVGW